MAEARHAVLIASSHFPSEPRLAGLRCPENDVDGMARVLSMPECGLFSPENIHVLKNRPQNEVLLTLNRVLQQALKEDFVLIYYSGHGKPDQIGRLHLATSDTNLDILAATSIPVETIRSFIDVSAARKIVMILDCCYSGAVGNAFLRGDVNQQLQAFSQSRGIYVLTASTGLQVAQEKEGDQFGLLTKHVIEGISGCGADLDGDGLITMDELYTYVHRRVTDEAPQQPEKFAFNVRGSLVLAKTGALAAANGTVAKQIEAEQRLPEWDTKPKPPTPWPGWKWVIPAAVVSIILLALFLTLHSGSSERVQAFDQAWHNQEPTAVIQPSDPILGFNLWRLTPAPDNASPAAVRSFVHRTDPQQTGSWVAARVPPNQSLTEGDEIRFSIEASVKGYLYVVNRDVDSAGGLGPPLLIFPTKRLGGGINLIQPGAPVEIPEFTDRPQTLTAELGRPNQIGIQVYLLWTPNSLPEITVQENEQQLTEAQFAKWSRDWGTHMQQAENKVVAGSLYTLSEQRAAAPDSKPLSATDPVPMTLFRRLDAPGQPLFATVLVKIAPPVSR